MGSQCIQTGERYPRPNWPRQIQVCVSSHRGSWCPESPQGWAGAQEQTGLGQPLFSPSPRGKSAWGEGESEGGSGRAMQGPLGLGREHRAGPPQAGCGDPALKGQRRPEEPMV